MASTQSTTVAETWKPIPGWEGFYEVSDMGAVRSLARRTSGPRGHYALTANMKLNPHNGYSRIQLMRSGKRYSVFVHRLVLETFVGPRGEGQECRHLDGNRANNCLENLVWGTHQENGADRIRHGTNMPGELNPRAILSESDVRQIISQRGVVPASDLAAKYGVRRYTIYEIWRKRKWKHVNVLSEPQ